MDSIVTSGGSALKGTDGLSRSKAISIELRRVARTARIPRPVSSGGGGFRARRTDRLYRRIFIGSFIGLFVLPVIAGAFYLFAVAENQYVSEAHFSVSSGEKNGMEALSSLASVLNVSQSTDGQIIAQYVKSRSIVEALEKTFDLRRMFSPGTWDFVAEAPKDLSIEKFVDYWNGQVKLSVDRTSGLVTLQVRTFSPQDSFALAKEITRISEGMVNKLTRHNEENTLLETSKELEFSKKRLEEAVAAMRDARNAAGVLDVELTASSYTELLTQLYIELSKMETQIDTLKNNNALETPRLSSLTARSEALRTQISNYENRVAGRPSIDQKGGTLAAQAGVLADKQVQLTIAQKEYALAVSSYEGARLASERQRAYLMTYVEPSVPEESLYPRRGFMLTALICLSFLTWAIVAGIAILVRDNTAA
jgi:capsular polysaccharide transport system permease protein